jgi:signal transduction histidine kinase
LSAQRSGIDVELDLPDKLPRLSTDLETAIFRTVQESLTNVHRHSGSVQNLTVVSGHPMLIQAAMDAVKQWRYKPYLLNGEPVLVL